MKITFMRFHRNIASIQKLPAGSMADGQDYFIILVLSVLLNFVFPVLVSLSAVCFYILSSGFLHYIPGKRFRIPEVVSIGLALVETPLKRTLLL
jgi:hypothetical protein